MGFVTKAAICLRCTVSPARFVGSVCRPQCPDWLPWNAFPLSGEARVWMCQSLSLSGSIRHPPPAVSPRTSMKPKQAFPVISPGPEPLFIRKPMVPGKPVVLSNPS